MTKYRSEMRKRLAPSPSNSSFIPTTEYTGNRRQAEDLRDIKSPSELLSQRRKQVIEYYKRSMI